MSVDVLYHDSCADGFGAAWAAWKYLDDGWGNDEVRYHRVQYGRPMPEIPDGSTVFILDFSYDAETLEALRPRVKQLTVLDHHRSAEKELAGLPYAIFDMNRSGAVMAWEFFFPKEPVPKLLQYVQDRDLWRWELPGSRDFSMGLRGLVDFDFELWDHIHRHPDEFEAILREGATLREYMNREIARKVWKASTWEIKGHRIPILNETTWNSETCEALLDRFPDAPCVATFFIGKEGEQIISLRTREDRNFDVSALAESFGGGGHRMAAGCHYEEKLNLKP